MSLRPPGRGTNLLEGAIDLHVHTAPALFERPYDDAETAALAKEAGMRAVVVKDHHSPTALRAYYARKIVPGVEVFGGVALNTYEGGLNPYIVESELKYGAKIVWMPTVTAENHLRVLGAPTFAGYDSTFKIPVEGITVLDEKGRLRAEVDPILELIRDEGAVLATGHLSLVETEALVDRALNVGVKKILLQHVNFIIPDLGPDVQRRFTERGVTMEYSYLPITPLWFNHPPKVLAEWLREVGTENCVLVTDVGNMYNPAPPEGLRIFIESLLTEGVPEGAIRTMAHENPARLLNLD
ncbi:MAG: DUF6282 family protein [Nitrospinota bacterium]